jgi:VanZ like family/Concanavalin A-like lectin/glucanases superfamily
MKRALTFRLRLALPHLKQVRMVGVGKILPLSRNILRFRRNLITILTIVPWVEHPGSDTQVPLTNAKFRLFAGRKRAEVLCIAAVLALLMATLWPLNPIPRNGVRWLQETAGIKFEGAGLVTSNESIRLPETNGKESYSLELLLRPTSTKSVYTILAFDTPNPPKQLLVRQWKDSLLVTHDSSVESDRTQTIKLDVDHVFHPGRLVYVAISSGPNGTNVYVDGQLAKSFRRFSISKADLAGKIVLGTSPLTYQPWSGELRGLSIYSKELTSADASRHYKEWIDPYGGPDLQYAVARYAFGEGAGREVRNEVASEPNLEIPATFAIPHKGMLRSPAKEFRANWMYTTDVLTNIAGFVPLGLIGCAYLSWMTRSWRAILFTAVACGILSLMIEVLQYYIPRRGSGTTDIITNTLGAAIGALLSQIGPVRRALEQMNLTPSNSDDVREIRHRSA